MSGSFLTAKALANRMKSKGLQRLRWYCQMCEKQCRDENGFKCHTRTEAHLRQMALFAQSADSFVERFSRHFCEGYLEVLRRQGGRRVKANHVYTQYIADKQHVHMNSTKWDTLSSFVSYLGKQRLAEVEQGRARRLAGQVRGQRPQGGRQTARAGRQGAQGAEQGAAGGGSDRGGDGGGHQRAAEAAGRGAVGERRWRGCGAREAAVGGRATAARMARGATRRLPRQRVQAALPSPLPGTAATAHSRGAAQQRRERSQRCGRQQRARSRRLKRKRCSRQPRVDGVGLSAAVHRKRSAVELVMEEEVRRKQQRTMAARLAPQPPSQSLQLPAAPSPSPSPSPAPSPAPPVELPWLSVGLVVKLLARSVQSGRYYGQKGRITAVDDPRYTATVAPSDPALAPVRLHQRELQTVIPAIGQPVRIVAGSRRRGETAALLALSGDQTTCSVECVSDGQRLDGMEFENVCKLVVESPRQSALPLRHAPHSEVGRLLAQVLKPIN